MLGLVYSFLALCASAFVLTRPDLKADIESELWNKRMYVFYTRWLFEVMDFIGGLIGPDMWMQSQVWTGGNSNLQDYSFVWMGKADAADFFLLECLQLIPQTFFAIIWVIVFCVPYLVQYILWGYRWALTAALSTFQFLAFQAIRQTIN